MTPQDKLKKLYSMKDELWPLTKVMIVFFAENRKGKLVPEEVQFVEDVYPQYSRNFLCDGCAERGPIHEPDCEFHV